MKKAALALAIVGAFGLLLGCGGAAEQGQKNWVDRPTGKKKTRVEFVEAEEVDNPRWDSLAEYFERYTKLPVSAQKDAFRSHLDKYVEKVEVQPLIAEVEEMAPTIEGTGQEELDPLKKFPADEFKLAIIMTGTGAPSALLNDPKGQAHIVRLDSEVGNEQGVVEAITQYEVVIRQPNEPKPVRLTLRPDVFKEGERQKREQEEQ